MFLKEHCARFGIQRTFLSSYPGSCQQSSWIITENKNGGWGGDGENGRALLSAAVRICLTILFPCSCRTFRRKIMLAVMTRSLNAINRQKCALILVVPHPIDGFVHDLYNDRKYCTRSRNCVVKLNSLSLLILNFFLFSISFLYEFANSSSLSLSLRVCQRGFVSIGNCDITKYLYTV